MMHELTGDHSQKIVTVNCQEPKLNERFIFIYVIDDAGGHGVQRRDTMWCMHVAARGLVRTFHCSLAFEVETTG